MQHEKIRMFQTGDLETVMEIWLSSNIQAHQFIDENYWKNNYCSVAEMLPQAEVYLYESDSVIHGFAGLMDNYIAGVFVAESFRSGGIGRELLNYIKCRRDELSLHVYEKNERARRFYQREGFHEIQMVVDKDTKEKEIQMEWQQKGK